MSHRFSGVIVESGSSGGVVPSRNKPVSFVDVDMVPVVFDGGVSSVTTDMNGRFGPLTHPSLTQILPVIDGRVGDDVISAAVDVGKLSAQVQSSSDAATQAAADAQATRQALSDVTRGDSHVLLDTDGIPYFDQSQPGTRVLTADLDGTPYFI